MQPLDQLPLITMLVFAPLAGVLFVGLNPCNTATEMRTARWAALLFSSISFLLSLVVWNKFDNSASGYQMVEQSEWFGRYFGYHVGVDSLSVMFLPLTAFLVPICLIASWKHTKYLKQYLIAFLVLETLMLGVFAAIDIILFYVLFEGVLIPMVLIIGIWGGSNRIYASFKFFLYTLLGSVLMLLGIIVLINHNQSGNIASYASNLIDADLQHWLWLAFLASFAVKLPMWPMHTWLPDAHVEAPTAGSVILAGVLLKLGGYGMLRFLLPVFPDATETFAPYMMWLGTIAIIYASLVALVQEDIKKLIAYSSVAHMGFVTLGIFSLTAVGIDGAIFQMLSHGLISSALFLCVGVLYDRLHTREISAYAGLTHLMPRFALLFMIFTMANIGLPGTSGFVGEFLSLAGGYDSSVYSHVPSVVIAAIGVILAAGYALWLYRRTMFETEIKETATVMVDVDKREAGMLASLAIAIILFGIMPGYILETIGETGTQLSHIFQH